MTARSALCIVIAGLALASTAFADEGRKGTGPELAALKIGQEAPDFTLLDSAGDKHKLSDYKDKVVVLEWLNQECPYSRRAAAVCKNLSAKYAGKGVVWLGVESTSWRKPQDNQEYAKEAGLKYPILMDNDGQVGKSYGARTTPHIFIINKGKLVYMGALSDDRDGKKKEGEVRNYVDDALAAMLAGKEVPLAQTTSWGCGVKYKHAGKPDDAAAAPKAAEKP